MIVRKMEEKDLDQVCQLEAYTFSRPWRRKDFEDAIREKYYCFYVAAEDNIVLATAGLICSLDEADITNVAVLPAYRRRGIARSLLRQMLVEAKTNGIKAFTLEVRAGNLAAIQMYESLGFVREGLRKEFYDLPCEDAVIMWKR